MYRYPSIAILLLLTCSIVQLGCAEANTPDTNVEVFRTQDEVLAARRAHQLKSWKEAAIEVLREERPDLTAQADEGTAIVITGDGMRERFDLAPVIPDLTATPDQTHNILRQHLLAQMLPFDQQRLSRMSFETVRGRIRPMLINGYDLADLNAAIAAPLSLPAHTIFADLYWIPVVRWNDANAPATRPPTPIGPRVLANWNIAAEQLHPLALNNVATEPVENTVEVTSFGTLGKIATLKDNVDPAILLSPNFLPAVRQALGTSDDLHLLLTTPKDVRLMEAQNKRLLDSLYPSWKLLVTNNRKAFTQRPLLLSQQGITNSTYVPPANLIRPTSMPTTNPLADLANRRPATRPAKPTGKPYIVR